MKNETKLTAADLAMYLGANCKTPVGSGVIAGISSDQNGDLVAVNMPGARQYMLPEDVRPILRPLSDMTADESEQHRRLMVPPTPVHLHLLSESSESFRYLLSRHFDLFGWIEKGLAIDKTKIETI